jgi:two-component system KDP operon response regulator KdpE
MARIQAVTRRKKQTNKETSTKDLLLGEWHIDPVKNLLYDHKNSVEIRLTVTEMNLLMHLIRNAGQVVTLKSIADEIWGTDYQGSNHAIRVYIQRLRGKIEYQGPPHSRVYRQLIFTQPGVGYYIKKL